MSKYHDREWLTEEGDPATPSVVSFAGLTNWADGEEPLYMVEISSCHDKVRLHKTHDQTLEDWKNQVEKLYAHVGRYLDYLSKTEASPGGRTSLDDLVSRLNEAENLIRSVRIIVQHSGEERWVNWHENSTEWLNRLGK